MVGSGGNRTGVLRSVRYPRDQAGASKPAARGPDHPRPARPSATRARPPERDAGHDRRLEGAGGRSPDRPVLRVPPQPGDLVALRLDLQVPARMPQVGRDGRVRVAPRPARAVPAPAGRGSHRLRGHPAQPRPPEAAADDGRQHDPRDEQRHLRRHLLGAPRVRHGRRRDRVPPRAPAAERHYAPVLSGFEAIDRGRRVLEDRTASAEARRAAEDLIWEGNVQLLEHEQRALVQPNLDGLSCAFARLFSIGSALSFEVRGLHDEVSYFTSFYYYSLTGGIRQVLARRRGRGSPASTTAGAGS